MVAEQAVQEDLVFGQFRVDMRAHMLFRGKEKVPLRKRSLDILCALADARGEIVNKDDLMRRVWGRAVVEENVLQVHVSALRKALGEDVGHQRHIVTALGRGYRFVENPPLLAAPSPSLDLAERASIAVMPFQNMSGDAAQDYFADGVVEDIITALTRVPTLFVVARHWSLKNRNSPTDIRQIGHELGVRYVLQGSVRKDANQLRISGQLLRGDTGIHVWAEHFDGKPADIFALQDELTARVVGALVPNLQSAEIERARRKPPESLDAYDLYLRALAHRNSLTSEGVSEALRLLERALVLDQKFAAAAVLASTLSAICGMQGWSDAEHAKTKVLQYARLAAQLDPHDAEALATLARWISLYEGKVQEARSLADRAVTLNPNSARVRRCAGWVYLDADEAEFALNHFRHGLQINPRDSWAHDPWSGAAQALIRLERDQEAVAAARSAVHLHPRFTPGVRVLAAALALAGESDEAHEVVRQLLELDPGCSMTALRTRVRADKRYSARYIEGLRMAGLPE